ncbi:unnamed protein product [Caenorhabditis auriculariae]|uniref:Alpha-galactosidase n=1 Tax=Caenorhabditis auriculariae TaxID=2777116 RepID=A0A8S1GUN1_9PELO|nr:unnamed protein product [Caenorhabditis auriculariae]
MLADFLAGWAAGGAGLLIGHPLDTVKARLQTMNAYSGILDCFTKTLRNESVGGLYKGMLVPFLSAGAQHSLIFLAYGGALKLLHPGESNVDARKDLPMREILLASICGTMLQLGPAIPIEMVKTKLQVQRENATLARKDQLLYRGPVDCLFKTYQYNGFMGLFKGGQVMFYRDNIGFLFYLPVYEGLLRLFRKNDLDNAAFQMLAGGIAGSTSWFSICPLEVLKKIEFRRIKYMRRSTCGNWREKFDEKKGSRPFIEAVWPLPNMWSLTPLLLTLGVAVALENGLARTPPMGWMSWTAFYCELNCTKYPTGCINERLYMDMADRLASDGYREAGYVSVHVDDCWMERNRDGAGVLVADRERFPSGMQALAQYTHTRGLKFGIYEDYGTLTCGGYPGSYGYLKIDAQTFANWEVDYLKLDGCNINLDLMPIGYPQMERELNATGRPIVYSCSWPAYLIDHPHLVNYHVIGKSCNLWRNFDDINSSWKSIQSIINYYDHNQDKHIPTHGPGRWHDPDMLVIGNKGITVDMSIAQMTIWCIWSAPLIMSNDLRIIGKEFREILLNREAIAIDQDPLGVMGRLVANTTDIGVYVKPITPTAGSRTSFAIGILNRNITNAKTVEVVLWTLGLKDEAGYRVKDVWEKSDLGILKPSDKLRTQVNPTGAALFRAELVNQAPSPDRPFFFGDVPNDAFFRPGRVFNERKLSGNYNPYAFSNEY